jgi:serine/threonine protein kinase
MQEVYSIRARRHPNVVEFYASFIAGRESPFRSNEEVECLHLLFEHADGGNMKDWLLQATTPCNLVNGLERGKEILHCVQDLVNAVTFIHSNIGGYTCFHHDIKPGNIVLFRGPPATWKLCDFGMANLKHHQDISGTLSGRYGGIGTYEYQPPEYSNEPHHGRSFDVYSLGCVLLELATIWAYGWNDHKLKEFRDLRGKNEQRVHPPRVDPDATDYSYHNNPNVVETWLEQLRLEKVDHECFKQFLDLTANMLKPRPQRVFIWEANMDLYEMVEKRSKSDLTSHFRKIVQPPKTPVNGLDNSHNPLQRATKRGTNWQVGILRDNDWSDEKPQTGLLPASSNGQEEHFSTLDACPKNDEYESNDLFGRHDIDKKISKMFDKRDFVGLYGASGVG